MNMLFYNYWESVFLILIVSKNLKNILLHEQNQDLPRMMRLLSRELTGQVLVFHLLISYLDHNLLRIMLGHLQKKLRVKSQVSSEDFTLSVKSLSKQSYKAGIVHTYWTFTL